MSKENPSLKRMISSTTLNPVLFEEDAIMRPDILDQLSIFCENNGSIDKIAPTLLKNFRGYPNLIAVITDILKQSGYSSSQTIINNCVQATMKQLFRISEMDNLLLTSQKIPKEFRNMFETPFWVDTFLHLSEKNPNSLFLGYCMNKICKKYPNLVTFLPPYTISYQSYITVLRYLLQQMKINHSQQFYDTFIKIISTDDRTLAHAAIAFHDLSNEALSKITDKLESRSHEKRDIFNKVSLALDSSCDDKITQIITSQQTLTIQQMKDLSEAKNLAPRIQLLFIKKLSELLKSGVKRPEMIETAVNCFLKLTNTEISEEKRSFICKVFTNIDRLSTFSQDKANLSQLLNCLDVPCFVDIFIDITISTITEMSSKLLPGKSPQSLIFQEIGFHHPNRAHEIIDALINEIKPNSSSDFLREVFATLYYFVRLGYSMYILTKYSKLINTPIKNSISEHRSFVRRLFTLDYPKNPESASVKQFIEAMGIILANNDIMNLIIPKQGTLGRIEKEWMSDLKHFLDSIPPDIDLHPKAANSIELIRNRVSLFAL